VPPGKTRSLRVRSWNVAVFNVRGRLLGILYSGEPGPFDAGLSRNDSSSVENRPESIPS